MNTGLLTNDAKKAFRAVALLYFCLSALFYCSCSRGSFYVLNTGQYMLEHNIDRQFYITSESRQPRESRQAPCVPIYKVAGKYYVAAERVSVRDNVAVGGFVGEEAAPTPYCFYLRHEDEKAYYEVELTSRSGRYFFSLPPGRTHTLTPAFTTLPADASVLMAYYSAPPYLTISSVWDDSGCRTYTCEKSGNTQLWLTDTTENLSWRALYGLPTAAVLFVAVDIPFDLMSFTGFCILSIFG